MNKILKFIDNKLPRAYRSKQNFVLNLKKNAVVLDVGCGNNSPMITKRWRKDLYYVGIDIGKYNNSDISLSRANEFHLSTPDRFADDIEKLGNRFDAVISSHNIEHCNHPENVLNSMCSVLKKDGMLYLAFPSEESVNFPHRKGTLNFYDDSTHIWLPDYKRIIHILKKNGIDIIFSKRKYQPIYYRLWGRINEKKSNRENRLLRGTWAFWGFESVIWGRKKFKS